MPAKSYNQIMELSDRSCDALVLAFSPNQVIGRDYEKGFYIPSSSDVERAYGHSLRKILGRKDGGNHWSDAVLWGNINNINKLEKRIHNGTSQVICGDHQYQTIFEGYLSSMSMNFGHMFMYGKGDIYRFLEGQREKTSQKFKAFWTKEEKKRWDKIHKFMREYTQENIIAKKR